MNWLINGYYGHGNIGDDILLSVLVEGVKRVDPDAKMVIVCSPQGLENLQEMRSEQVSLLSCSSRREIITYLMKCDVLLWGGGTCLHSQGFCGFMRNILARLFFKKVFWLAIGVEEVKGFYARLKGKVSLACCNYITLRDKVSEGFLQAIGPRFRNYAIAEDLVWLYECKDGPQAAGDEKYMVLIWRDNSSIVDAKQERRLLEAIINQSIAFSRKNHIGRIVVANMATHVDFEISKSLQALIQEALPESSGINVDFFNYNGIEGGVELLHSASMIISCRMHPFLIAKVLNVPCVPVVYSDKVRIYADYFVSQEVVDLYGHCDESEIGKSLDSEFAEPATNREGFGALRDKAERNFTLLEKFINKTKS